MALILRQRTPNDKVPAKSIEADLRLSQGRFVEDPALWGASMSAPACSHLRCDQRGLRSSIVSSFDAQTEQYVDMLNAGIVDPAKVVRVALQDAASIAGLVITTEAMVAETPKKKEAPAMPGGGMGGGMDY
jgi:hypothetical protein